MNTYLIVLYLFIEMASINAALWASYTNERFAIISALGKLVRMEVAVSLKDGLSMYTDTLSDNYAS